jgi:endonuclease-3
MDVMKERLRRLDSVLTEMYGPKPLRPHGDPLGELVHIILTQNTSDANSDRTYAALRAAYPSWDQAALAPPGDIADVIRMGGLSDIKAVRIGDALRRIEADFGSISLASLDTMEKTDAFDYLTSLPGVGPKTAACVLLFALGRPVFPVDTHVHRVSNRLGLVATRSPAATQAALMPAVPDEIVYQLHMNMVTHGRKACKAGRPACSRCLLQSECDWACERAQAVADSETQYATPNSAGDNG